MNNLGSGLLLVHFRYLSRTTTQSLNRVLSSSVHILHALSRRIYWFLRRTLKTQQYIVAGVVSVCWTVEWLRMVFYQKNSRRWECYANDFCEKSEWMQDVNRVFMSSDRRRTELARRRTERRCRDTRNSLLSRVARMSIKRLLFFPSFWPALAPRSLRKHPSSQSYLPPLFQWQLKWMTSNRWQVTRNTLKLHAIRSKSDSKETSYRPFCLQPDSKFSRHRRAYRGKQVFGLLRRQTHKFVPIRVLNFLPPLQA